VIFVEQKPRPGEERRVADGMTIGREGCDLNLVDSEVSRRHAEIRTSGGSLGIEDLGSTNGTFVNEKRITGLTVLSHGDRVQVGGTVWAVTVDDATRAQPRGDVPAPPSVAPSAIRRVLPPPGAGQAFSPPGARPGGSAATRVEATVVCMVVIAAVAIALIVYFATY
jgi:predicted component of type VI protein secretion system